MEHFIKLSISNLERTYVYEDMYEDAILFLQNICFRMAPYKCIV